MNPGQVAVTPGEAAELNLLGVPENAQGKKTHEIDQKAGTQREQGLSELPLGLNVTCLNADFEDQQRHCHAENGVAQIREATCVRAGDIVGGNRHPEKSIAGRILGVKPVFENLVIRAVF